MTPGYNRIIFILFILLALVGQASAALYLVNGTTYPMIYNGTFASENINYMEQYSNGYDLFWNGGLIQTVWDGVYAYDTIAYPENGTAISPWTFWHVESYNPTNKKWGETIPVSNQFIKIDNNTLKRVMVMGSGEKFNITYHNYGTRIKQDLELTAGLARQYRLTYRIDSVAAQDVNVDTKKFTPGFFSNFTIFDVTDVLPYTVNRTYNETSGVWEGDGSYLYGWNTTATIDNTNKKRYFTLSNEQIMTVGQVVDIDPSWSTNGSTTPAWQNTSMDNVTSDLGDRNVKVGFLADNFDDNSCDWTGTYVCENGYLNFTDSSSTAGTTKAIPFKNFTVSSSIRTNIINKRAAIGMGATFVAGTGGGYFSSNYWIIYDGYDFDMTNSTNVPENSVWNNNIIFVTENIGTPGNITKLYYGNVLKGIDTTTVNSATLILKSYSPLGDIWYDNIRAWQNNETSGNLTAWHDFGADRQGSKVMANFTNTTGATFVDLYDSSDNSTFSLLASNVSNATWISLNQKAQVQAVRVVLKGNTTLTPEIIEITMEDEAAAVGGDLPNFTSWGNDATNNETLSFTVERNTNVTFNGTANQTLTSCSWLGATQINCSADTYAYKLFDVAGTYYTNISGSNANGSTLNTVNWTITVQDTVPPASITGLTNVTGNFYHNWSWTNPADADFSHSIIYINDTFVVNTSEFFYNLSSSAHNESTISVRTVDTSGTINQTPVNHTSMIANNVPILTQIGAQNINEGQSLNFSINGTDADSDSLTCSSNETKSGMSNCNFNWSTGYSDAGTFAWIFYLNDSYGGSDSEIVTVTINEVDTNSTPLISDVVNGTVGDVFGIVNFTVNQSDALTHVKYSTDLSLASQTTNDTTGTARTVNITGLNNNTKYYYSVFAYNLSNNAKYSNSTIQNFTTNSNATVPPAITSWGNNQTNDQSLSISIITGQFVRFNATANQTISYWNWSKT